jgi:hypothetical protein
MQLIDKNGAKVESFSKIKETICELYADLLQQQSVDENSWPDFMANIKKMDDFNRDLREGPMIVPRGGSHHKKYAKRPITRE